MSRLELACVAALAVIAAAPIAHAVDAPATDAPASAATPPTAVMQGVAPRNPPPANPTPASPTLVATRAAAQLSCGAIAEPEDWTKSDLHGNIAGFDIEICKAVAVATLGAKAKVAVHLYASAIEAGDGLRRGEVALVVGITPNATAVWRDRITFGPVVFYDGLSVLVRGDSDIASVADLGGARVCYIQGTDNEDIVLARTIDRGIKILPFPFQEEGEMEDGLSARHCDAIAADVTHLAIERASYPKTLAHDRILSDWMTIDPIAVATRQGDAQWSSIVAWTVYALTEAEQLGIDRADVGTIGRTKRAEDPEVARFLGTDWTAARALGLADHGWAADVIAVTGNYGEIYDRTVGGPDRLPRGRNALWNAGGLMVPMPVQ